jgi:ParB family chromosome partitioning protein
MAEESRPRLGRGLAALLGENATTFEKPDANAAIRKLPIEFLRPNPRNPRRHFAEDDLASLVESIKEKGVIQPILARPLSGTPNVYELIAGERRWRAAQKAGLHELPVVVVEVSDKESLELAIVENVQRADLNAIEEAQGYEKLISEFDYTQNDLAKIIGKSRSHIANTMRLLKLPDSSRKLLEEGHLSAGHARALLAAADPDALAARVVAEGLTVRDVEQMVSPQGDGEAAKPRSARAPKDADTRACEQDLSDALGLVVKIDPQGRGGRLSVRYANLEQLDMLIEKLKA